MLITADIGNTTVALGGFAGEHLVFLRRLPSDRSLDAPGWLAALSALLASVNALPAEGSVLSSVVPDLTPRVANALESLTGHPTLIVSRDTPTGLSIPHYDTSALGMDRVVDCVAALARCAPPVAVFDMGTATTLTVINENRELVGGMILPGLGLSLDALSARAAQLPPIDLTPPAGLIGTDTVSCMNNGALYGAAGAIEGIVRRLEEVFHPLHVILTGGMAPHVLPLLRLTPDYQPHLQLLGLRELWLTTPHGPAAK